ncbi:hypothetical protein PFICI_08704 [Pestalotiopsis fici W106-1]|uniref:Methyltransferase type 12 domain-containing protein n=1 Tax=Pestalotiopsis fici (strain W106-1 / CGMCC3.15140) TaxID=1229662 RepID=W3X117_PESFW|nr:uncharacterized protein PFICI_08704 [Pestalotiopsis fici W106-1]ETS78851.1 hypothetical protein PFICI_08704 [Pestalotiopsis fici W106-1]
MGIVDPYVLNVRSFIKDTFSKAPDAVDLGCGDFNVGRRIRSAADHYVACDVVPAMIEYNRVAYAVEDVDFRVLDIVTAELPPGDVVFIRQVLQHLSNKQISDFLPKLGQYQWAIITEHIPFDDPFTPNHDILTGNVRVMFNSGVELTEPPFNLVYYDKKVLCELRAKDGRIRTVAYQLQDTNQRS